MDQRGRYRTHVAFRTGTPVWPMLPLSGPLKPWAAVLAKMPTAPGPLWPSAAAACPKQFGGLEASPSAEVGASASVPTAATATAKRFIETSAFVGHEADPPSRAPACQSFRTPGACRAETPTASHRTLPVSDLTDAGSLRDKELPALAGNEASHSRHAVAVLTLSASRKASGRSM